MSNWSPVVLKGYDGVVVYDGVCVLCSKWFHFVASRDASVHFRFLAIQDPEGIALAQSLHVSAADPQTNIVVMDGMAYFKSDAALQVLKRLPWWGWVRVGYMVPRKLRHWLYDQIAQHRYRLFGKREACFVPTPALRRHLWTSR